MTDLSNLIAQFPRFDVKTLPAIPAGFIDQSWRNDSCPSFFNATAELKLWVDFLNPEDREHPETSRFSLERTYSKNLGAPVVTVIDTDSWNELLAAYASTLLDIEIDRTETLFGKADANDVLRMGSKIAEQLGLTGARDAEGSFYFTADPVKVGKDIDWNTQTAIRIAKKFGEKLQEQLTAAQMREVLYLNKVEPEGSGVCHSHDFCDANMPMMEAFVEVLDLDEDSDDFNVANDTQTALWNAAWDIAKAAEFFV